MIDLRPVLQIVGLLLCLLAAAMVVPGTVAAAMGDGGWRVFAASAGFTLTVGLALVLGNRAPWHKLTVRQTYLATVLGWVVPILFAALPFVFGTTRLTVVDAMFEATSGLTATGSTVISGLDALPPGLALWRGLMQWLGGMGMIAMAMAVLPILSIGGMQIFRVEMAASSERLTPRAARISSAIVGAYLLITSALALLLWLAGMSGLDAWIHAMTTISTGGFSTSDGSVGHFGSASIDIIITIGMVLGGMPFMLFFQAARGNFLAIRRDQQLHWYLGILALASVAIWVWLMLTQGYGMVQALRHAIFTVVSVMTGSGFFTVDFGAWTGLPLAILFFLTFVGGCAGSTAAGIKVFRFHLLFANARVQMRRLLRPNAVMIPTFNHRPIPIETLRSVLGFIFVYALAFACLSMALALLGLDFVTAISAAATSISNVGPGLGDAIGPGGSYAAFSDTVKWLLCAGMVFGRLEMFLVLVLFLPNFWRQ